MQLVTSRLLVLIESFLQRKFHTDFEFIKNFIPSRYSLSRKKAVRQVEQSFIEFIINIAANSTFGPDLQWQIESFKSKSKRDQSKLFPGFYLYVERYLFNSQVTSIHSFREVLYQQFKVAIDQSSALKIIFDSPDKQKIELYRKFLYSVARKSERYIRSSRGIAFCLQYWLEGKNSFVTFSKVTNKRGADLFVQIAHDFFIALCEQLSEKQALKIFNEAYDRQALRYQNLDCFHELLKLFPNQALDETKFNLLSNQQMKSLLAEKVEMLEKATQELHEKNNLLTQWHDEVLTQSEQLNAQNLQLAEAQSLIEMMNEELSSYSIRLEEKIAERTKELAHKNEMLIHYNNNLEQYTFTISHQLKAPIARILGLTNLLKMVPANEKPVITNSVHQSAKELEGIFKDLVHALNFKKEVAELKRERIDVKELLTSSWIEAIKNHETVPEMELKVSNNLSMETDRKHLTEALTRIFDNAIKFNRPCQNIVTEVDRANDSLKIQICDRGIGFDSDEVKNKLFTPFQRFNITHKGKGLGLYLTKQHISILGGDVRINSALNKGTIVKIELPIRLN